jgi:flavorubredoxin
MTDASTHVDEIADGVFRLSTFVEASGLTFCQYLLRAEQPLLFHCGHRALFGPVREAVDTVLPASSLRWIAFGHHEADESGSMNEWLATAPDAQVLSGFTGGLVNLMDLADRPPHLVADGDVVDLGGLRVRHLDTPHVPHGWDARLLFEEQTGTLLCGDLFTATGAVAATTTDDLVEPALAAEDLFGATCLTPATGTTIRRLAELAPSTLAPMHAPASSVGAVAALDALADAYDERLAAATP